MGEGRHPGQMEASKQGSERRKCPTRRHEMVSPGLWAAGSPGLPLGRAGDTAATSWSLSARLPCQQAPG